MNQYIGKKSKEEIKRVQELRRSSASGPVLKKKSRKGEKSKAIKDNQDS